MLLPDLQLGTTGGDTGQGHLLVICGTKGGFKGVCEINCPQRVKELIESLDEIKSRLCKS